MAKKTIIPSVTALILSAILLSCSKDEEPVPMVAKDINTATKAVIDRFSSTAGHLMVRTSENGLPASNAAIDFDSQPFITKGLDRTGAPIEYYNFDVQPTIPANIYVFFKSDANTPVSGQNNIIASIPGNNGYSDFWVVNKVTIPENYVPNSLTSEAEVLSSGYAITKTTTIVNCPVVPFGSTALRSFTQGTASSLTLGWYKGMAVAYFNFGEAPLELTSNGMVPTSPIYVMFNENELGPSSGFKTEVDDPTQTHNVLATLPGDTFYSPLWNVFVIDNKNFDDVINLEIAISYPTTPASANVNCPVIK